MTSFFKPQEICLPFGEKLTSMTQSVSLEMDFNVKEGEIPQVRRFTYEITIDKKA